MSFKKSGKGILVGCLLSVMLTATAFAATESLNNGGATWYGGEDGEGILYSRLEDNKADNLRYKVTVWVKSDTGLKSEKTGTTNGVGKSGSVEVTRASTHKKPFTPEKAGYKDFEVVSESIS